MSDGVIHVESPSQRGYTLGQFFDIWGQPLSATQAGPVTGTVTAFYRGKPYTGSDLRAIPLTAHADIQPIGSTPITFQLVPGGLRVLANPDLWGSPEATAVHARAR